MKDFIGWLGNKLDEPITESIDNTRYSIEMNYRSKVKEVLDAYAKITLGFVSAALKKEDFHVKHVYDQEPLRIVISSRNWDDGEWATVITWNPNHRCFYLIKGFYNKSRKTVSKQSIQKCAGDNASELVREAKNAMHSLKGKPDRHIMKLKKVPMKRGPKK